MRQQLLVHLLLSIWAICKAVPLVPEADKTPATPYGLEPDEDGNIRIDDMLIKVTRNGVRYNRWPFGRIYYKISGDFNATHLENIATAMHNIEAVSCVRFCKATALTPFYVNITGDGEGCYAAVGFQMSVQVLNLDTTQPKCHNASVVTHELLHSVGFQHQHCNYNRDDYVDIFWDKIEPGKEVFYQKSSIWEVTDFGLPYDYGSLTHYARRGFSIDGQPTMLPKNTSIEIGQRRNMSDLDIEKINRMYSCSLWPFK